MENLMEFLAPGTLFRFPGKKTVYRILRAGWLFVQYENPKRKDSLYEIGYHQKKFNQLVEVVEKGEAAIAKATN